MEGIGALDGGMLLCGGQNVELGLRGEYFPSSLWVKVEGDVTESPKNLGILQLTQLSVLLKRWTDEHIFSP